MGICDRCETEYESYNVYITDNFCSMVAHQKLIEDGFENLCKPCRKFFVEERNIIGHAFTTENEQVEPKYDIN